MNEIPAAAIGSLLSTLRTLPIWVLGGLAAAGYALLFVPAFGGIDPAGFRTEWGILVWAEALTFSILTLARGLDATVTGYRRQLKSKEARRALRFVPLHQQCWWHLAKQQDDSFCSQIRMDIEAANVTDRPVRIVKVSLIRPRAKGELLHAQVLLPMVGSPYHSEKHAVPPHGTARASLHLMFRGTLCPQGKSLCITLGIIDQFGEEYRVKRIVVPTHDPVLPASPWMVRLITRLKKWRGLWQDANPAVDVTPIPPEWQHGGKFEEADLILMEEKRNYAACGRNRGGLGSLNVGLQSEPNFGWTTTGNIPSLLWDQAEAKPIELANIERLMRMHAAFDETCKADLERYLLSHLHKRSPFADVGYFVFLALHRMGRMIDALREARANLSDDKVYGYSNLLGTLSALVSREHFAISPEIYTQILEALIGDTENNFRLPEKINLARLQHIDLRAS